MNNEYTQQYDFTGKTIVITGGAGVLCSQMARALFICGANVAILDYNLEAASRLAADLRPIPGFGKAAAFRANVLENASVQEAVDAVLAEFGRIDGLINGAGGNKPEATSTPDKSFFDLPPEALRWVFDLNLLGTIIPSQVIGKLMAEQKTGVILNISSMNAFRPLTRIPAYSAAKAGVSNFTQWLAVHMAQEYSPEIRVNALAPGFFLTAQNEFLLTGQATGKLTGPGESIITHTPMGRFGKPEDLLGAV